MSEHPDQHQHLVEVVATASGVDEIHLRGELLHVTIVPGAGGKISEVVHPASGTNVLWENPRVALRRTYAGAPFDDVWSGGWDDIFPTDPPCEFDGGTYHDHGDLWIGEWDWTIEHDSPDRATVHLSRESVSLPCRADKWITIERDSPMASVRLRLTNTGLRPIQFMWNQHIAHAIHIGSRIHMPTDAMDVIGHSTSLGDVAHVEWPIDRGVDLSYLAGPDAGTLEFLSASGINEGWCAVTHPDQGLAVRIGFDTGVFRTPWLWRVSGGWRGHHLLLTELCTSRPGSLADSIVNGSAAMLAAASTLETVVTLSVHSEFDRQAPGNVDPTLT